MKQFRENLLLQFSVVCLLATVIVALTLSGVMARYLRDTVLEEAAAEAQDTLSFRIASQLTEEDFVRPMTGERYDAFNHFVQQSVVSGRTARIKLWNREGMVLYSTDQAQVGQIFPIKPALAKALDGEVAREISVPAGVENVRERLLGTLIEVYVPLRLAGGPEVRGSFETYQFYAPYATYISRATRYTYLVVGLGFLLLYLALVLLVARGWRDIQRSRQETTRRIEEIRGLNNLLQGHLEQRLRIIEKMRALAEQLHVDDPQLAVHAYNELHHGLRSLAEEASASPTLGRQA